ncbi:glycine cleavage system protein H, partial [Staphylococcus pseudintermedius]
MAVPSGLKYSKEHEWVKVEGNTAIIGITDFAQSELGDIVFVELPEVEDELTEGETFGSVESVKTVSELY